MLWRTDEIRVEPPQPIDEARNGVYYLEGLAAAALPDVLEELRDQLAAIGVTLPAEVRPLRFGTWIGGDRDGNPNVTPATTRDVLELQAVHGIRLLSGEVNRLRRDLSVSERLSTISEELRARLEEMLPNLPEVEPRYRRLNAEEPYRLFLTCVHVRLQLTEERIANGRQHRDGRDYRDDTELLEDLLVLHRSVLEHQGELVAGGRAGAARPHRRGHRPHPGHARRARARQEAPRGRRPAARPAPWREVVERGRDHDDLRRARPGGSHEGAQRGAGRGTPALHAAAPARRRGHGDRGDVHHDPLGARHPGPAHRGELHHLDDPARRRRVRRRGAGPRGRPGRPGRRRRPDRLRAAAGDRRGAGEDRGDPGGALRRRVVPPAALAARRRAGGDARLLRLQQGRRHRPVAVADPARPAPGPRRRPPARRPAPLLPRARRLGRPGRRSDVRRDHGAALRHGRGRGEDHRAGRGDQRQVRPAGAGPAEPRADAGRDARGEPAAQEGPPQPGGRRALGRPDGPALRGRAHPLPRTDRVRRAAGVLPGLHPGRPAGRAAHRLASRPASRC